MEDVVTSVNAAWGALVVVALFIGYRVYKAKTKPKSTGPGGGGGGGDKPPVRPK